MSNQYPGIDPQAVVPPSVVYDPKNFIPNSANGQHILLDGEVIRRTAELLPPGERYIEIGAGPGTLTATLLSRAREVVAYEVDERCKPMLGALAEAGNLTVRWQNFLEAPEEDIEAVQPFHVVGNIPFHISEPLVGKLTDLRFSSAVLLVGKNLVRSMTAPNPDSASWSRLSLLSTAYFDVEPVLEVPRASFDPPPRVDAGLIRITRKDATPSWRSDAVVRSYRAIVEARRTNSTVAKALKTVVVTPGGDAEAGSGSKRAPSRRTSRRLAKAALNDMARDYNNGGPAGTGTTSDRTSQNMLSIVAKTVDERLLSKPLSGLSNKELAHVCSAITTAINRRKKSR